MSPRHQQRSSLPRLPRGLRRYRRAPWTVLALLAAGLILSRFPQVADFFRPAPAPGEEATVVRVIDGDTFDLADRRRVRLIGVDTPEMAYSPRARVEGVSDPYAIEATAFVRANLEGRRVRLEYGPEQEDRFDRTLAYVFLEDGALLNAELLRRGYARTTHFEHPRLAEFLAYEDEARSARLGLWSLEP